MLLFLPTYETVWGIWGTWTWIHPSIQILWEVHSSKLRSCREKHRRPAAGPCDIRGQRSASLKHIFLFFGWLYRVASCQDFFFFQVFGPERSLSLYISLKWKINHEWPPCLAFCLLLCWQDLLNMQKRSKKPRRSFCKTGCYYSSWIRRRLSF